MDFRPYFNLKIILMKLLDGLDGLECSRRTCSVTDQYCEIHRLTMTDSPAEGEGTGEGWGRTWTRDGRGIGTGLGTGLRIFILPLCMISRVWGWALEVIRR